MKVAMGVAKGLAYLHSRNIVHRDMRPSNILIRHDHESLVRFYPIFESWNSNQSNKLKPSLTRSDSYYISFTPWLFLSRNIISYARPVVSLFCSSETNGMCRFTMRSMTSYWEVLFSSWYHRINVTINYFHNFMD